MIETGAYKKYIIAAKNLREACHAESIEMHRLSFMSEKTRVLWVVRQKAGAAWLEEDNWDKTNEQ